MISAKGVPRRPRARHDGSVHTPHHVVLLAYDDVELLDLAGPASVFAAATVLLKDTAPGYHLTIASQKEGLTPTSCGVRMFADCSLDRARAIDSLIVPGSFRVGACPVDAALVASVRRAAKRAGRLAAVCSGAFVLAEAGLLDGKRVTTHWAGCGAFRARYPTCRVEEDAIFVRDGSVWTSAGVTAGIDLALALVEQDHGRELTLTIARWLVVYLHRPGGQSQFSVPLQQQVAETEPMRELLAWMREHPASDLSVPALARRVGMSERTFARAFRRELGTTPAVHVAALRLEAARRALERTALSNKEVALRTGFGTVESLHRVFQRSLRVTPGQYRERFRTRGGSALKR
jgi:transcriptional regulator GlxA family with amidase domain